jgi:hypothetical protein
MSHKIKSHTPGPWFYREEKITNQEHAGPYQDGDITIAGVCTVWRGTGTHSKCADETRANGLLLAAAPDLLAALQAFVDYYGQAGIGAALEDDGNDGFDGDEKFNVRLARAAITRAKGA